METQEEGEEEDFCVICLCDTPCPETRSMCVNGCTALYHEECLDEWKKRKKTCPSCRANLDVRVISVRPAGELERETERERDRQRERQRARESPHFNNNLDQCVLTLICAFLYYLFVGMLFSTVFRSLSPHPKFLSPGDDIYFNTTTKRVVIYYHNHMDIDEWNHITASLFKRDGRGSAILLKKDADTELETYSHVNILAIFHASPPVHEFILQFQDCFTGCNEVSINDVPAPHIFKIVPSDELSADELSPFSLHFAISALLGTITILIMWLLFSVRVRYTLSYLD